MTKSIGILGAGAFGTALAISYSKDYRIFLFSGFEEHVKSMKETRRNEFFEEFQIPDNVNIDVVDNLKKDALDYIFWVFPVKPSIEILTSLKNVINGSNIIICSKGLNNNGGFLFDSFKELLSDSKIGYLSGPNFALELAEHKLSIADIAAENIFEAKIFAKDLSHKYFKLNSIDDIAGIQICGAVKNIIAIACGIADGLGTGRNAQSAILTYGLDEMKRLGEKLGAKESTFYGLCGIGDLVLTASSDASRNRILGKRIANGEKVSVICDTKKSACEGYDTLYQVIELAKLNKVKMPICQSVFEILFEDADLKSILNAF